DRYQSTARDLSIPGSDDLVARRFLDLNGDGWLDILSWADDEWVFRAGPLFDYRQTPGACDNDSDACSDMLSDGQLFDLYGTGRQRAMLGPGTTNFRMLTFAPTSVSTTNLSIPKPEDDHQFVVTDMNGDGLPDLIVSRAYN